MSDYQNKNLQSDAPKTIDDLLEIMAALRAPVTGCPWDLEQNFQTIAPYTIEEAYEVADAIARDDLVDLNEELGDLLLQVVYHAQMAEEVGAFDFSDVVTGISRKMVRRHPHVFGNEDVRAAVDVKGLWERVKAEERRDKKRLKGAKSPCDGLASARLLDDVPLALPALTRALKLQDKAAKVGFDWPSLAPVLDKVREEFTELEDAIASTSADAIEDELGDVLFVLANIARHARVDPEAALRRTNEKFVRRWRRIEELLAADERKTEDCGLEELDRLWNVAKREERTEPIHDIAKSQDD